MPAKRAAVVLFFSTGFFPGVSRADLRIAFRETYPTATATRVEYYRGNLWRTDSRAGGSYTIVDSAKRQSTTIDPASHTYSVQSLPPKASAPVFGRTMVVEIESRDTGEQRQMFGHVVHHIVTAQRRHTGSTLSP
jgi:hypothetical protein